MSQSPKHSTPFSVTDILSPLEESYKKAVAAAAAAAAENSGLGSTAYRSPQSQTAMNVPVTNPYMHMSHPVNTFPTQYCNGTDISAHYGYGDVKPSAPGWYGTTQDPRFASKCPLQCSSRFITSVISASLHGTTLVPINWTRLLSICMPLFCFFSSCGVGLTWNFFKSTNKFPT